ncbi:MAG: guanosine polyphosphate pyrophosphohydrolase/synthetase [Caudoviricetes sp.]|nr:MAG: guanosine polyphosphate pyrophosphohydrolase/synthetase [Caudoviricetes sp.]
MDIEKYLDCFFSKKLLHKLIILNEKTTNKIDIKEIKKAIYYAKKYHGDQMRQSGEPYYSHPLEVAFMVADYLPKTDIIVTSILHDTLEDTELTFELIEMEFGGVIAHQVLDLTRTNGNDGRKISAAETVKHLLENKKYELLLIKLFDRLHNMQTIRAKPAEKVNKITKETLEEFLVVAFFLEIPELRNNLIKLCYQALSIKPPSDFESYLNDFQDNFQPLSLVV